MTSKRKAITPAMKIQCLLYRAEVKCSICGHDIYPDEEIEWDHIHALVHSGPHEYQNLRPVHAKCHKAKTASDIAANAKVKRILADKPARRPMKNSGKKLPSRPFPKRAA